MLQQESARLPEPKSRRLVAGLTRCRDALILRRPKKASNALTVTDLVGTPWGRADKSPLKFNPLLVELAETPVLETGALISVGVRVSRGGPIFEHLGWKV